MLLLKISKRPKFRHVPLGFTGRPGAPEDSCWSPFFTQLNTDHKPKITEIKGSLGFKNMCASRTDRDRELLLTRSICPY